MGRYIKDVHGPDMGIVMDHVHDRTSNSGDPCALSSGGLNWDHVLVQLEYDTSLPDNLV